jgi:hypothetical protein
LSVNLKIACSSLVDLSKVDERVPYDAVLCVDLDVEGW